jgi:hypothetical protein
MTPDEKIEKAIAGIRAQNGGRAESEGVSRQQHVQRETRPQSEKEKFPDYYNREREKEGRGR